VTRIPRLDAKCPAQYIGGPGSGLADETEEQEQDLPVESHSHLLPAMIGSISPR
jgi:hypothetical protein